MKQFMDKDFLLSTETAKYLYHNHAAKMPIIDYHCHINPQEIYEDKKYDTITEVWLGGDHYKWRAIRSNGVDERYITGDSTDYEKFEKWAETLPRAIGNPLYHWTHLELKKYFDFHEPLSGKNCKAVYEMCNKKLQDPSLSVRGIINQSNVKVICTTDDPTDTLEWHKKLKADSSFKTKVLPAFRPDKAVNIDKAGFVEYIAKLSGVVGYDIKTMADLYKAIGSRIDYFHENGCRASDHGIDYCVYSPASEDQLNRILADALAGRAVSQEDTDRYKTALLLFVGRQYAHHGWVMEIHFGCIRNNNSRMFKKLGPDTGFDAMGNSTGADKLAKFLDCLDSTDELPKTILFSLNPYDNQIIDTLLGCFQSTEIPGKLQNGSAWWFNDTKEGMIKQMKDLADLSLLGNFTGMLTDSRSFLSYTRHEY